MGDNFLKNDFTLFAAGNGVSKNSIEKYFNYINPTILEERQLNVTQMDVFSRLFMERILYVGGVINSDVANILTSQLLYLEMQDSKSPITMYINSPGGSVIDGLAIYDTMQFIKPDVRTIVVGMAASMGSILLSGGAKGKRAALPNAEVMIHQPSGGSKGMASDMEIAWKHMERCKEKLTKYLVKNSGRDPENPDDYNKVLADMDRDYWMSAEEALEYGLIDKIIQTK